MMKNLKHNQEFRLNEILFENRNKAYGAYALRTESDRILTKAFFMGIGLLAAVSIIPIAVSSFKTPEVVEKITIFDEYLINDVETNDPPVEDTSPQTKTTPPPSIRQYDSQVATPTRNADESTIVKNIPKDAVAGVINNSDAPPSTTINAPTTISTEPGIIAPPQIIATDPVNPNKIVEGAELAKSADFEGGIDAFRNKVMNRFDVSAFESQDVVSTKITFIVETNGTISNIKANGKDISFNEEAMRTIKSVKGKWIPGKNKKGQPVRSYFNFPISMKFDN